ncbi:GTP cyclohydrolase FolE2, partial [Pseudomonas cannabina pv. alisalensis]
MSCRQHYASPPAAKFASETTDTMNSPLPDVALTEVSSALIALDWVGMQGVEVPLMLGEPGATHPVHAYADLQV